MEYPKYDIIIENCYFYSKPQRKATYIIGGGGNEKINYYIKNMKVNVGCNDLYITQGGNECIIEVENLLIKGKCNSVKFASSATFFVKSIVQYATNAQGETLKYYYGSNFSGFYFSWQTGNIGLIALDGRGSFQGKIDEEWLLRKGFEKKEV